MKIFLSLLLSGLLFGCAQNSVPSIEFISDIDSYDTQHEAALAFFDSNKDLIEDLMTTRKEVVGLILKCDDKYKFTNYFTGGVYNHFRPIIKKRCSMNAIAHTHPDIRGNQNQFSKADLKTAKNYDLYLQSPDMKIRYANRKGIFVVRH